MTLTVTIPGPPVGKGRPRFDPRTRRTYTPPATRKWEASAAAWFRHAAWDQGWQVGRDVAVRVEIDAVKARPQRLEAKRHFDGRILRTTKPDGDNVAKAVLDAAQQAGVLHDDAQVAHIVVRSSYAARGEGPGVHVTMEVM